MSIADTYDTLRSKRPYKPELSHDTAVNIIINGDERIQPKHFDPKILQVFKEHSKLFDEILEKNKDS